MKTTLRRSYELSEKMNECLRGIVIPSDDSSFIPTLFHNVAIEHQRSVAVLIDHQLYSSACSIVRSLFEAYVKGVWFYECAEEVHFTRLREDKFEKPFWQLVSEIDEAKGSDLSRSKQLYWRSLNSLTHTGAAQLKRRVNQDEIRQNYDDDFLKETLMFSDNYAFLACGELAKISGCTGAQAKFLAIAADRALTGEL